MKISFKPEGLENWLGDVLVVCVTEESFEIEISKLELHFNGKLQSSLTLDNFNAKVGEIISFRLLDGNIGKLVLAGLGKQDTVNSNTIRMAIAKGARSSIGSNGTLGIKLSWNLFDSLITPKTICETIRLSLFKDLRYRSNPDPYIIPEQIDLIGLNQSEEILKSLESISPICAGVELARELVGAPPNDLTPSKLAETAQLLSRKYNLKANILDEAECKRKGMGAYLAVSQGSDLEPKFIHLVYKPKGEVTRKLAIIGKGLTFDSGGYNLKVGASQIELMKFDMGGSAAVLGAARAIGELCPESIEVNFIVAACENMVNGSAVHPGDIVKASNGKTIEINNTDAEGRLTLADALVYACKLKPDAIVDLATLTGACVIALGDEMAGLWSDNDLLAKQLIDSANVAGEGLWRMPLHEAYKEGLKSMLADIKNTGPRAGGSITAALFLKEFVDSSIPWAHIDIAGPVWAEKEKGVHVAGATGYGVRTLVNWITRDPSQKS